jgi:dienelactone hydrolase
MLKSKFTRFWLILSVLASAAWVYGAEMRTMRYKSGTAEQTTAWQNDLRAKLFKLLKLDDLLPDLNKLTFDAKEIRTWEMPGYTVKEMSIRSTPGRMMEIVLTIPKEGKGPFPAVVCIGGHSSTKFSPYTNGQAFGPLPADKSDGSPLYKGFAADLAKDGFVTISTLVSQHEIYEKDRMLMGERLWDLMRCVSYLESLPTVDKSRIGCGGLSLGGEMTMWLAAMDTRIAAADSDGFLTVMDQMEKGHCMCWKFDGLRELVDYADIYALIAPRPLECQNGRKEPPGSFTPALAQKALAEIRPAYAAFDKPNNASLDIHDGAHEVDLPMILAFFNKHLKAND